MENETMLTFTEAQRRLGIKYSTLVRSIARAGIQTFVDGTDARKRLVRLSDVEKLKLPRPSVKA